MNRKISEAEFLKQVLALAKLCGWKSAHFRPGMTQRGRWVTAVQGDGRGFPDLVLLHPERGKLVVVECKVGYNPTTPEQDLWLEWFEACGVDTYVWTPDNWCVIEAVLRVER